MFWRRKKDYIICASHRSGSTLLCEGVRWTWRCGDPKEYLSPTRSVAMFEKEEIATDPVADFPGYVREVFETKRMENGVFGMKIMWKHLQKFPQRMEIPCAMRDHRRLARVLRSSFGPARYIWSRREDKVRQAISFLKAKQTRLFTHQQRALGGHLDETALEFDFDAISALVTRLEREEEEWKTFFDLNGITPLIVTYEDFAPDYEETIKGCLKHIGVYEESLEIAAPNRNQKLADPVSETWVRLYGEEKAKREAAS
jgi:LPS sulfotransferase NodH